MKKNYIVSGLEKTVREMYPDKAQELITALEKRIAVIREENSGETKDKKFHLENQIMPGIAAYKTLSAVMPKEKALDIIHGYIEDNAHSIRPSSVSCVFRSSIKPYHGCSQKVRVKCSARALAFWQTRFRRAAACGVSIC